MATNPRATASLLSIGASEFPDLRYGRRPTTAASARGLAQVLAGNGVWDLRENPDAVLAGEVTKRDSLDALKKAAKDPVDLLVVYLGCHGRRFQNQPDELQLALTDTDFDLFSTHLPFSQIKEILREATAPHRLLLLDCCYADDSFLGTAVEIPTLRVAGASTLSATAYRQEAVASWKDTGHTAFAGALIEILEHGIPRAPGRLTIDRIFQELRTRLVAHDMPTPGMRGDAGQLVLCVNRHAETLPVPQPPPMRLPGSPSPVLTLAPAAFAEHLRGGPDRVVPRDADRLLTDFVRLRTVEEIADLASATTPDERPERAAVIGGHVLALRELDDFLALVHLLHEHDTLGAGAVFGLLDPRPLPELVTALGTLTSRGCADCLRVAGSLARQPAVEWPVERLAELFAALRPGLARAPGPAETRNAVLEPLTTARLRVLAGYLWSADDNPDVTPERRWDALDVTGRAAVTASPAELYESAVRLAGESSRELGNILLEFAAGCRSTGEVAELLRHAEQDADFAELLRRTTLRRHPPGFVADLLDMLGNGSLPADASRGRDALLDCAADPARGLSSRDLARLLLLLHRRGQSALKAALDATVRHRMPDQVAETAVQLHRYGGPAAGLLTERLVRSGPEAGKAVEVLRLLLRQGREPLVEDMVDQAARGLGLHHVLHMACLLADSEPHHLARGLVRTVLSQRLTPSGTTDSLAHSLDLLMAGHRTSHEQLAWLLGAIAESCAVDKAWELITWARNSQHSSEAAVFTAVCRVWPAARIEELADYLRRKNWNPLARHLMEHAVAAFARERVLGTEIGELIVVLRSLADRRVPRDAERKLVEGLAAKGDATQVMMLIDQLSGVGTYDRNLHKLLRQAVLRHFDATALIRLSLVHHAEHLPVVLDIEMEALLNPSRVPPERVPGVLRALRDAGAPDDDLAAVCDYVGATRHVDRPQVIGNLRTAGLRAEADAYAAGNRLRRPRFFDP